MGGNSWLANFGALKIAEAGSVAALDRLSLPLVFVFGALALRETPTWRGWVGVGLAVAGTYTIAWDDLHRAAAGRSGSAAC